MWRPYLSLAAATLILGGCAAGGSAMRESPARFGVHLYGAPAFQVGESERTTAHPVLGYSRIDGLDLVAMGAQIRQALDAADGRLWVGAEGSYLRISGINAYSVGGLAGYELSGFAWPLAAYGYLGYLDAVGTGFYGRLGVEVRPPQLMELLPQ